MPGIAAICDGFLLLEHSADLRSSKAPVPSYGRTASSALTLREQKVSRHLTLTSEGEFGPLNAAIPDKLSSFPSDKAALSSLLRKYGDDGALQQGKRLHSHILNHRILGNDTLLANLLVQMYSKCNSFDDALNVFTDIRQKNVYSWCLILGACTLHGKQELALELFHQMRTDGVLPDEVTYVTILDACESKSTLSEGEFIHSEALENGFEMDIFVGTALLSMYGRCHALDAACAMFDRMPQRSVVSWNAMGTLYVQSGRKRKALEMFHKMLENQVSPSNVSFLWALDACGTLEDVHSLHDCIRRFNYESEDLVCTTLVSTYGRLGKLDDARKVFESIQSKTAVSWSAIIAIYAQNGECEETLDLFQKMKLSGVSPVEAILTSVVSVCALDATLTIGEHIYYQGLCLGMDQDMIFLNALVDMYANCGCLEIAQEIFDKMQEKDLSSWNIITGAHALYGHANVVFKLFEKMLQEDATPDGFTFSNILSGCSHAGLVGEAGFYISSMHELFGILQMVEQFNCVIDLLARLGRLDESELIIKHMSVEPTYSSWMPLLNGCKAHNDKQRANRIAAHLFNLEHKNASPFVVLSHSLQLESD